MGYEPERFLLEIEFRDGAVYQYARVPSHVFAGLVHAVSKGRFFHQYILDRYPTVKVRDARD